MGACRGLCHDAAGRDGRAEPAGPGGTIYISREAADRLEGRLRVTSLGGSIQLKGKAEGFEVLIMEGIL